MNGPTQDEARCLRVARENTSQATVVKQEGGHWYDHDLAVQQVQVAGAAAATAAALAASRSADAAEAQAKALTRIAKSLEDLARYAATS